MTQGIFDRPYVNFFPTIFTCRDLIDRLIDYSNSGATQPQLQDFRIAIDEAYRELAYMHVWKYMSGEYSLALVAPVNDGTIAYANSSRTVTLTGATFPSWSAYGHLRIGNTFYDVESNPTSTTLVLSVANNPGVDIEAGTTYILYRSTYTLPADFRGMHKGNVPNAMWVGQYIEPDEWFRLERRTAAAGNPRAWTIMADPKLYGSYAVFLWPHPSTANTYAFIYARKPRELRVSGYNASTDYPGTVSISANGTSVTGVGTNFTQLIKGTMIRFGDSTNVPTGHTGMHPYAEQRIVTEVDSTTSLQVNSPVVNAYSAVKYCVSDVVDMPSQLLDALLAGIKYKYTFNRPSSASAIQTVLANYEWAILKAKENDAIVLSGRYEAPFRWDRMHDHTFDPPPT